MLHQQLPTWEVLHADDAPVSAGSKRSHDYSVDEFFTDMKKRRVTPSYDSQMAERLNNLAYSQRHVPSFNPRSVSLDIRTPEELAAVNEFLVTLGRNVAVRPTTHQVPPSNTSFPPDYFDPVSLSQLGLAGMPGMPHAPNQFSPESTGYPHSPSQQFNPGFSSRFTNGASMYPSPTDVYSSAEYAHARRSSTSSQKFMAGPGGYPAHYHHSSPDSPHSTTPPLDTFDYIRASRGPPPAATISPVEYMNKAMRPMVPLKSVPRPISHSPPSPSRSVSPTPTERTSSLYPLLTNGDVKYRLPPLMRASPSPPPNGNTKTLPGIHELAADIGKIDIGPVGEEQRRHHAELIRDLLVGINQDFKRRYCAEKPQPLARKLNSVESADVEMVAV